MNRLIGAVSPHRNKEKSKQAHFGPPINWQRGALLCIAQFAPLSTASFALLRERASRYGLGELLAAES
jgi:hypothetical protein